MGALEIVLIIVAGIVLLFVLLLYLVSCVFYAVAFNRELPSFTEKILKDTSEPSKDELKKEKLELETTAFVNNDNDSLDLTVTSFDGLKLHSKYVPSETPSKITVHLVHGFHGICTSDFCGVILHYHNLGYNVNLVDDRGHRESEGNYLGFGWLDRLDTIEWCKKLVEMNGEDSEIILHGVSMGAATVMMASGEETLPKQVKAIIEDCGYTSAMDEFRHTIPIKLPFIVKPVLGFANLISKHRNGFYLTEASSVKELQKCRTPMLFIHGDADDFVPFKMVHENYAACAAEKDLFIVPGAVHARSQAHDVEAYCGKVDEFLRNYIAKEA